MKIVVNFTYSIYIYTIYIQLYAVVFCIRRQPSNKYLARNGRRRIAGTGQKAHDNKHLNAVSRNHNFEEMLRLCDSWNQYPSILSYRKLVKRFKLWKAFNFTIILIKILTGGADKQNTLSGLKIMVWK